MTWTACAPTSDGMWMVNPPRRDGEIAQGCRSSYAQVWGGARGWKLGLGDVAGGVSAMASGKARLKTAGSGSAGGEDGIAEPAIAIARQIAQKSPGRPTGLRGVGVGKSGRSIANVWITDDRAVSSDSRPMRSSC